jgi:hypothetical protein
MQKFFVLIHHVVQRPVLYDVLATILAELPCKIQVGKDFDHPTRELFFVAWLYCMSIPSV